MRIRNLISVAFLFLSCWIDPIFGTPSNQMLSHEQIEQFELAFERAGALAPAPTPTNNTVIPFPCQTGGACKDVVKKYGYNCEEHTVATKDGHFLSMQRIPSTKGVTLSNSSMSANSTPPVLLQHGLFCDGVVWMGLEGDSLAFYLADHGFDVWINNNRGTKYSRCHRWLNPIEPAFWEFSWQELSEIDLDATVNYVHKKTGQKVHYVGHSMGTLVALAALAANQSTIKKMRSVALLCPIGYMNFLSSVFGRVSADLFLAELRNLALIHECNPVGRLPATFAELVCKMFNIDCSFSMWFATGPNCCIDPDSFNRFLEHEPQSTSTKVLMHLSQNIRGGGLAKYDYGLIGNMLRYKQATPPPYLVKEIPKDFPIFLGYGGTDTLGDIIDVLRLIGDLKDHKKDKLVRNFQMFYAHMDYIMAHSALEDVYKPMISFFNSN